MDCVQGRIGLFELRLRRRVRDPTRQNLDDSAWVFVQVPAASHGAELPSFCRSASISLRSSLLRRISSPSELGALSLVHDAQNAIWSPSKNRINTCNSPLSANWPLSSQGWIPSPKVPFRLGRFRCKDGFLARKCLPSLRVSAGTGVRYSPFAAPSEWE